MVMTGIVLGIDPGLKGALAFFDLQGGTLEIFAMPTRTERRSGGKHKTYVDEDAFCALVRERLPDFAIIEDVHVIAKRKGPDGQPGGGDGVVGAFSFGEGKGILKGGLAGLGVQRRYVSPQKWKADLGLIGAAKSASKPRAHRLLPGCIKMLSSEGKSEAALIGLWAVCQSGAAMGTLANLRPAL